MFDPSLANDRLTRLWNLPAHFGVERGANHVLLEEVVSDRMQLLRGLQVLRDELMFASPTGSGDQEACAADLSVPSVVTTLAYTNCGDRIHHGETEHYQRVVASRFATMHSTFKPTWAATTKRGRTVEPANPGGASREPPAARSSEHLHTTTKTTMYIAAYETTSASQTSSFCAPRECQPRKASTSPRSSLQASSRFPECSIPRAPCKAKWTSEDSRT